MSDAHRTTPWEPIHTAPTDGRLILLYWRRDGDHIMETGWWESGINDRCWYSSNNEPCHPSHWMPLPEPPHA